MSCAYEYLDVTAIYENVTALFQFMLMDDRRCYNCGYIVYRVSELTCYNHVTVLGWCQ